MITMTLTIHPGEAPADLAEWAASLPFVAGFEIGPSSEIDIDEVATFIEFEMPTLSELQEAFPGLPIDLSRTDKIVVVGEGDEAIACWLNLGGRIYEFTNLSEMEAT